ncbi:filamentous hemagglutinin N-terminal domain-containing protein [Polynucleobacter paneuropaeus]|nr:filamentous hemagglutinin N-terminal domain-containing protein [Polynucleobacter paneuropaeus]
MERSLLSSNHPEKQFDVKLPMAGKVFALVCLFALSTQFALAQNKIAVNALPTGGNVVAGAATISSTSTAKSATMNINQTSQRAVINWQTFNVGKNATVNFNQPNSGSVTLNRVVSATPSMIQGAINANGQVILVNPNGVTFGKGAQVNAAGVVASTLNISNQDFMNGKNIYSGNGEGKIVNKGTITATDPNGYIALLAPEIRNQGYLIARMGPSSTVALASGEKISLDFRGTQLIGVSIDKAAYKALIENKRIIETNGGVIIVAAGTARELMSSVIQNTGRISANSIVDNGGVIELVADNVTNSGSISANGGTNGVGGQVNIVGNNITLAANSKTTATGNLGGGSIQVGVGKTVATNTTPASAVNGNANTAAAPQTAAQILASNTQGAGTQAQTVSVEQGAVVDASAINSGNGGAIVIWSQVKTTVNGILKAVGGYLNGNGGLIETSSAGLVSLGKSLSIDTSSSKGSAGLWYVDPIDLTIDGASSAVISAALVNNNVSITVAGNTCPSLGSCTQNGSGNLTIASGADIIKQSGSLTTLTLTASGVFNLNANISGQNLDVIINSSIAYLNAGSTITANQVTVQAQTIYSYGNINSGSLSNLGSAIQLLGSALYISGNLTVGANLANSSNSTSSNSNTVSYNGTLIRQEDLPTYLAAANQTTLNLDQVYATTAANQASFTTAVNNQITLTGTESISIAATAQLLANGTTGGVIMATAPQINLVTTSNSSPSSGSQSIQGNGSLIQANGNNGPGGTISFTAANDFNINVATISASGSTDGGSIRLISSGGNLLMANSLIQTNGGTGRGGSLGVSGANSTTINSSTLEATGFSKGGSIMVGYDSAGKSIPFSQSTTIDASTILNANQTDGTNSTDGGLIETSGGTLVQLASINAGRGGMWLLDPYDYIIGANEAAAIVAVLNSRSNVTISTSAASSNGINANSGNNGTGTISVISDIVEPTQNGGGSELLTLDAGTQKIYLSANINTRGGVNFSSPVVLRRNTVTLSSDVNYMNFASTVDGDPGFQMASLVINSSAIFNGNVGSIRPLANLKVTGSTQFYGDVTVYGGSSNYLYGTNSAIYISSDVALRGNARITSIGDSDIAFLGSITTGEYLPASTGGITNLTVSAAAGNVYFGSTVNLTGSLSVTAATTYLASSVITTGAQTYNGNVNVLSASTQITTTNSNLSISGTLSGTYLATSPIFLYFNGDYAYTSDGQVRHFNSLGDYVELAGGRLTFVSWSSSQTTYSWTPLYDAVGSVLAVGGGAGGGAGAYFGAPGGGGNGGAVVTNRLVEFTPNSTYTITVGAGGVGGITHYDGSSNAGTNGGNTTLMLGNVSWITANGGNGSNSSGNGGANQPLPGNVPGSGIQAFPLVGLANMVDGRISAFTTTSSYYSGATLYSTVNSGNNGTYFGAGGNFGTAYTALAGLPANTNTGSGGGGGSALGNGMVSRGGDGAGGVLMLNQVTSPTTSVNFSLGSGTLNLGAVTGVTPGTINGASISDGNGGYVLGSSLSNVSFSGGGTNLISGKITGNVSFVSYGSARFGSPGNVSTYTGTTAVQGGILYAGSSSAFGNSIIDVRNGASLDLNGQTFTKINSIQIVGAGYNQLGALLNSDPSSTATLAYGSSVTASGAFAIGGPGALNLTNAIVDDWGNGIAFVNGASVSAMNISNSISSIASANGSNVKSINLTSTNGLNVGTVLGYQGLTASADVYLVVLHGGLTVSKDISALGGITLFGQRSDQDPGTGQYVGVLIGDGVRINSPTGIQIFGNGQNDSYGVMIGAGAQLSGVGVSIFGYAGSNYAVGYTNTLGKVGVYVTGGNSASAPTVIDGRTGAVNITGYSSGIATTSVGGIAIGNYALLIAGGDITLAASTPNANLTPIDGAGSAVYLSSTVIKAGGNFTIMGATPTLMTPVDAYPVYIAQQLPGTAVISGNQFGIKLNGAPSTVSYQSNSYSGINAIGDIWMAANSTGGAYAYHAIADSSSLTSTNGSITLIGIAGGNQADGIYLGPSVNLVTNRADITLRGSNTGSASGMGIYLDTSVVVDSAGVLTLVGYASGSYPGGVFGIASKNYSGTLIKSGGNMVLAASAPNAVSGTTSFMNTGSAAIDIHTVLNSGGNININNGAGLVTLTNQNGATGTSIINVATINTNAAVSSSASGVAIANFTGVSYQGQTYTNTVASGYINIQAKGADLGIYIDGSLTSQSGNISLFGAASALGGTGVMVQISGSENLVINAPGSLNGNNLGNILISGVSSSSFSGQGIWFRGNGAAQIVVSAGGELDIYGFAQGTGTNFGIRADGYGAFISGAYPSGSSMTLAANTPNSRYGSGLRSSYVISSGGDLTIEGSTLSPDPTVATAGHQWSVTNESSAISLSIAGNIVYRGVTYSGVSAVQDIAIYGRSLTNAASDLTASDGHSHNYGVDIGSGNLKAGRNIQINAMTEGLGVGAGANDYGNSGLVLGNISSGGYITLSSNCDDYSVYGGMTITSSGGIYVYGTGSIDLKGNWSNKGATGGIDIETGGDVRIETLANSGAGGIFITGGMGLGAGVVAGGTIRNLGAINNTGGVVWLSMAAPSSGYSVEAAIGITTANAELHRNIQYGMPAGDISHGLNYVGGNFINYRQALSLTYNVTLNNNYSAIYGTTTMSQSAMLWLHDSSNVSLAVAGTAFGVSQQTALGALRFQVANRGWDGGPNLDIVQNATPITQQNIFSVDGAIVNVVGNTKTYTITPAPLGISVTGAYTNSATITPSSFTTYGLVNGEVITSLSSVTAAFKDVLAGNNYITGAVVGTGTASMSNYQLSPLGRNITPNSTLQNMVTITPVAITVTGVTASNKVYDGTTTAVVNSSGATLNGKFSGDNVTLSMTAGSFMSPGVGTGITVSGAGSLQGTSASNYTLNSILLAGNITPAPLGVTVTGAYSNSTTITPTSFTTTGLVNGETITTLTSAIVSDKNVSANGSNYVKSITKGNGTATLNNYAINTSYNASSGNTQNTATIDPKVLSVSGTAVADKVYNGTASVTLTNGVLNGVNPGDSITLTQAGEFSQANVGTSITVVARDAISDSSGNYTLQQPQTLNASITPKLVTLSATKTYDATTSLTGVVTIGGLVGSETLNYTGATAYSANAGGVNFIAAMTLANGSNGGLASNYVLPSLGTFANAPVTITPKALNLSATKVYDATTSLTGAITINGLISGQTLNYSGATAHTANAGSTYIDAITITNGTGGGLASNYQVPTLTSAYTYNNVTINRKAVTLSASKVYDGSADLTGAVTVGGLIGSQTLSYTGAIASDINVATSNKYILNIALSDGTNGGIATNYSLPASGLTAVTAPVTITPKALTVTGTTVPDKVYDGSTTTTLANGVLVGVVDKDIGSVTLNQSGTFASPNAGSNVAVVANDSLNLTAGAIGNYTLVQPTTTTGNITPKALTVSGTTVDNKVYDGTGLATLRGGTLVGVVAGDATSVSLTQAGVFAQWNTGGAIAVLPSDSISGPKAANYTLTQPTGLGADITPRPLGITVTGVYNGTNAISVTSFTTNGLVTGEAILTLSSVSVSNPNVAATGKYVGALLAYTGNTSSGSVNQFWGSNYSITQAYNPTAGNTQNIATITPIALTVTGTTVPNKVYDGSTATTLANGVLNGVINGQTVGLVQAGTFASPNAGSNVAVVANDSLSGDAAVLSNYTLIQPTTTTGNITPAPVIVNNTSVANKTYDGTNVATLTGGTLIGVIAGDLANVTLNQSGTFASVNVGNAIAVTATDSLSGIKAANYTLTQPSVSAANITPAPLGISITNAVYQASTSLYPVGLNFTVTGLVHGETITTLGSATVANANVSANGSNYLTAMTVGSGTATLSNYSLNSGYSAAVNNTQNKVTLTPMLVTVTGTTVPDKVYDGTTTTTLAGGTLVGVFSTDRNNVSLNQSGTFASPNAGNNVAVVANDSLNLTASAVGNYTLTQPTTTTGNIIKAPLGVTVNGIYSGGVLAPTAFTTNGLLNGETITALSSATPHDPNVATTSNYVSAITISGGTASMNNYALTQAYNASVGNTQNTVTITPKAVTLTGTKVYDGTLTGAVNGGTLTIGGLVGSQTLNYSGVTVNDANVGTNKYITAITLADGSLGGIASNYALPSLAAASSNNTATITPAPLGITASAVYNGTTFFLNPSAFTTTGLMNGETITVLSSVTLNNANVASNGSNYVASAYILTGTASLSNYSLTNRYNISSGSTQNSAVITPAPVTVNGTNIANKVYDGSVVAGLTGGTLSGVIAADIALVSLNQSGNFASANIGTGIAVIATDSLSGTKATNYALTQPTALSANITAKNLTVTGTTVSAKTYDGTNVATLLTGNLVGVVNGESVTLTQAGIFSSANAGVGLVVTASDVIGGAAAANYTLTQPTGLTGTINPKALTVTSVTASNKVYDGLTSVTFSNAAGLVGVIGSDNVILAQAGSFASKNVGTGIAVTTNNTISGTAAANYTLVQPTGITANITPAPLGVTVTGVYSGSTTVTPTSFTTTGLQGSDTITALSSANFSNANVSANSSNYVTAVTIGSGTASMSNYAITQAYNATPGNTLNTATITPKALTLSASKVYDGSTTGASVNISGLIGGQTLNYSDVRLSDQNVATANKYISAITLADGAGGGIASNYVPPSLSAASASNSVTITPLMVRLSANKEYDGTTSLTGKVTISGLVGSETLNYTGATAISPNVGANYINAIALADGTNGGLASNYQIPNLTLAYTNNNAQVTAKAISISATKVYDATADLTNAITITGLIGNQTLNYSGATANSANVLGASYINAITFTDGANGGLERNYIVPTLTGANTNNSVSITAAPLSLSRTKIYDGSRTGGTGTLNIGGLIGAQTLSSSDVTVNDQNVGTDKYITAITLADGANGGITSNYALPNLTVASARNSGSITPRDLTITVSAQTKTYGDGIAQTSNTQDGSINLTPVSGHTSGTASNVDTRTTALSDIQYVNYTGNTANNSTAGFSVDGLVANDVVRTVNISSSGGALTANANVNGVLAYAITASGAVGTGLSNYNISYVANNYSVLTITPRKLVVTAATATMVYGASALPTLSTSSITGWANTADQAITSIALSAQDATGKLVKANIGGVAGSPVVGTYSVVATGVNGNPNYVIDTVNSTPGQFTITPASLTITANSLGGPGAPILYGTPTVLKPDAFTSSGLTNGDSLSTATITFNSATTVAGTTTPGIYTPVVSGPSSTGGLQISGASGPTFVASNYVINYVAGSLTIGQAKLTVSAVNDAKLQGQQDANGYNGVIVSGFVNGDTLSVLNTTGLSITRNNAVNNTAPGTYNGVLIASGVSLADLNSTNYSIAYQPGNFTIVPPNQLLIKVAPVTTQYGSAIYTGSSPVTATYLTSLGSSPQSINALISGGGSNYQVNLGSGQSSASAPLVIGTAADISSSGNLNVGSYNLSPIAQQINLQGTGLTSTVAVGGISITPKTLSFADLGSVTLTKDYDGKASSTVPVPALSSTFLSGDNVTATASGTFTNLITGMPDANAGINKSYTIAVSFSPKLTTPGANQTDANNYVLTGGGIYTADGGTGINHGPANGVINVLDSVTYIGAASGAAWSSASSWANGAVPTYANVRNIIVPVGFSVVYDAGVAGPVAANLQNAGNVNFNTDMGLAISMNISGAGSITISGTGQVSLSGNNTYTGNAIINNGAKLVATYGNTIGAGNIQGLGGTFQTTPGTIFTQINATGSLILASDITTTGNQTYGNITFSQPRTTLLSQFGSITINGTVDSGTANVNTLLLQAPTGSVSLRGSVGSIKPLNVLEIDAVSTYLYADVLTADQQNYCGAAGCYTAITPAQVTASYCATNDCYSKNNDTSAYNLLASGTGGSGNFAKSANIGQLFIGDVGQVGFLYNKYNQYASKSVADGGFGTPTPLFNNNSIYARTLMSMDPTVNLGSYVSDVSVTPTHTIQVAAIQATGVTASPTIQMSGSGKTQSTSALYSLSALTQGATWAGTYSDSAPIEAANYIALGSKALNLNNASLTAPTLNLVYPPSGTLTTNASSSFTANNASINGRATTTIGGRSLTPYTPATPSPSGVTGARSLATPATPATPTTRNSFILAAVAEQTKIERKYDVDASVDVGEIETDDGPAAADDQDDKKKKKAGNQKAAQ